jgi:RNA polymerase sigma-70 factor (ECF subfamily)
VYRYACRRGFQDADAADLTQDVIRKVARTIQSFEYQPERGRFRDWLLKITRNGIAEFYKSRARSPEQPFRIGELEQLGGDDDRPDADWNEAFNARVLRFALDRIQPQYEAVTWCAFERVWLLGRSAAETADDLSLPIEKVYYAKSRILKRLREEVVEIVEDYSGLDLFDVLKAGFSDQVK